MKTMKQTIHPRIIKTIQMDKDVLKEVELMAFEDDMKFWSNSKDPVLPKYEPIKSDFLPSKPSKWAFFSIIFP